MNHTSADIVWILTSSVLIFMMQGGFLCLEAGLTRTKHSINVAIKNLTDFAISVIIYWLVGFALMFGISQNGWFGTTHFMTEIGHGDPWLSVFFLFQVMFCGTSVTIISGAVAERIRFGAYILVCVIVSGLIYPVFGHWAWGGAYQGNPGWLVSRGFVDFAGSSVVHSVGGWASLAVLLVIGPREGRFPEKGPPQKIEGSNLPLAMLGVFLLWIGWIGFNGGSTLAANEHVPGIIANTVLAGSAGLIATLWFGWRFYGYADPNLVINGSLAGLVAITANCHAVSAIDAIMIGSVGGLIMLLGVHLLEFFKIDDAVGAIPVHLFAGIWGTLAVAIFGNPEILNNGLSRMDQFQIQFLGVVVCAVFCFGVPYLILSAVHRFKSLRVTREQEALGLNIVEHRAKTAVLELMDFMKQQAMHRDLSMRAPVEPFTEIGQIAKIYNEVMQTLEDTMRKTEAIVRTSKDGILTLKPYNLVMTSVNESIQLMFGYTDSQMIGQSIRMILGGRSEVETMDDADLLHLLLRHDRLPLEGKRSDGASFPVEISTAEVVSDQEIFYTMIIRDITEREQNQKQLEARASELECINENLVGAKTAMSRVVIELERERKDRERILNSIGEGVCGLDLEGRIVFVNPVVIGLLGYKSGEGLIGQDHHTLMHAQRADAEMYPREECPIWDTIQHGRIRSSAEDVFWRRDGTSFPVEYISTPIREDGKFCGAVVSFRDITKSKNLEEQFRHAQKMEAVGRFAGSLAHDFNNLLSIISGYNERLLDSADPQHRSFKYLEEIRKATDRAASLTGQLLTFSRRKVTNPKIVNCKDILLDNKDMIQSLAGETVKLVFSLDAPVGMVKADPGQIEQVLINLVVNARDALPSGGQIMIRLENKTVHDRDIPLKSKLKGGEYVCLVVSDNGVGMSEEVQKKIFDPFFTTKPKGKGTGLGLATCYGIVEQNGGFIEVLSQLNQGSTFKTYLPLVSVQKTGDAEKKPAKDELGRLKPAWETVLLVEDEAPLRALIANTLRDQGYQLFEAGDGEEALAFTEKHHGSKIHLLLTDIMMPKLDGKALYDRLKSRDPEMKVILMSGYTEDKTVQEVVREGKVAFMQKPFSQAGLTRRIREVLDA